MVTEMERRKFLGVCAGFASACLAFPLRLVAAVAPLTNGGTEAHPETELFKLFSDFDAVKEIGMGYLQHYPEKANRDRLLSDIDINLSSLTRGSVYSLGEKLRLKREQEFFEGKTVVVNNWILTQTEASLCALLVLSIA